MNEHYLRERKAFLAEVEAPLGKSDYLTVLSLAESRLKRMPADLDARIVICRVWIEQGRFEEAGEMLREMEDILASLSQVYPRMGDIYLKKGMPEPAQAFYRMFLNVNPDTPMAREISEKLEAIPRLHAADNGAIAEKEEAAHVPGDLQTVTLAELSARQGHLRMAEEILEGILGKGPYHPKAAELLREVRERIASQEKTEETHTPVISPDAGERLVGRGEPVERPAPGILREIGEGIATQERAEEKAEPQTPGDVSEGIATRTEPGGKHAPVIAELSRWLNNIGRLSSHAA